MKTKEITVCYGWQNKEMKIPAGLSVVLATNLPAERPIKFWLSELTPEMEANDEFESWYRNYGIGLSIQEVDYDKNVIAMAFLEEIRHLPVDKAGVSLYLAEKALEYLK